MTVKKFCFFVTLTKICEYFRTLLQDPLCLSRRSTLEPQSPMMQCMFGWRMSVPDGFEMCIREFSPFDGKHQNTVGVCIFLPSEYHHRHHHLYDNNHHHYCHYYSYPSPRLSSLNHHHIRVTDNQHYHRQHFQYPFNIIIFVTILIVVFIILMYFLLL